MLSVLRVVAARSCLEGRTDLRRLSVWSFPIASKVEQISEDRWDDDWAQFWFYAKVAFPGSEDPAEVSYPLASKVELLGHISQAEFRRSADGYKDCLDTFSIVAMLIGGGT